MTRGVRKGSFLIIHQGALGDLILSLPALYCLRLFYEGIPWTMAGNLEILSLLYNRFYAQEIISIHQKEWAWLYQEKTAIPDQFRTYLSSFQKAYLFSAHQPEILIQGLIRAGLAKVLWIPSLPSVEQGTSLQLLQRKILASKNIPWIESGQYIFPSQKDLGEARNYLTQHLKTKKDQPLWAIHPGSGSPYKNWPLERFLEVALELLNLNRVKPFFLLGPVEDEDSNGMGGMIEAAGFPIIKELSLPMLAGVLSHCTGFLGNDSGVSHLAAALGLPATVLFGPTNPSLWGPKGKTVRILASGIPCAPCDRKTCQSCITKECLAELTVRQVLEAIEYLL
ncbi:MAG: glycosyltransferase family 9 protein [Thermodesulfobacteriota bacterium]